MSLIDTRSDFLPTFLVPTPGEEALLRRYGPCIAPRREAFTERWVALLQQEQSLRPLLRKGFLTQTRELMESHYAALLCAEYDAERRAVLQHAGAGYQQMSLPIQWITLSYDLLAEDFEIGTEELCLVPELSRALRHALRRRLQLDMFWLEEGFQQAAAQRAASREVFYLASTQVNRSLPLRIFFSEWPPQWPKSCRHL